LSRETFGSLKKVTKHTGSVWEIVTLRHMQRKEMRKAPVISSQKNFKERLNRLGKLSRIDEVLQPRRTPCADRHGTDYAQ
jgi:hypothetical protein